MKAHRKIFMSFMTMLLLVLTFSASTFAWFQMNSSSKISGFDMTVTGGLGFLVSVDGTNFSNDLTRSQMNKAMIVGYDREMYSMNERGELVYKTSGLALTNTEIEDILTKKILLLPVTSQNGYKFTDLYGSPITVSSGRFVEFDLYFKTVSNNVEEAAKYDISLLIGNEEIYADNGQRVYSTQFSSELDNIELFDSLTTRDKVYQANETIPVYTSNALRFSLENILEDEYNPENEDGITHEQYIKNQRDSNTSIYEFVDEHDLGSYAIKGSTVDIYDPTTNAMFTYYNNQKVTDIEPLSSMPTVIRYNQTTNKLTHNSEKGIEELENMPVLLRVQSGLQPKKVTVRMWIEGWDADCFDGISKSIKVRLTFTSKQIK